MGKLKNLERKRESSKREKRKVGLAIILIAIVIVAVFICYLVYNQVKFVPFLNKKPWVNKESIKIQFENLKIIFPINSSNLSG